MSFVTTKDGTEIFYKDWGTGRPVVMAHGWPLNSDSWESQQFFLAGNGYRAIAHDRRGHGKSTQTWDGNEMDTYADDLAALMDALDLTNVTLMGFSTGGGEITRYIGRHGTSRLAQAVLISAVPPLMLKTDDNPGGVPIDVFDGLRESSLADRAQLYRDLASGPFFGNNKNPGAASEGVQMSFVTQSLASGHRNAFESIAAFSATDFREDLKKFDVPTLVIHGTEDQIVPFEVGGKASSALIDGAEFKAYEGAPHGLADTHKERLNNDLLEFLKTVS
ncbi:alpha/beta hydrolase [Arthrobacter sp. MSA 4-2]|uniref:alpha/beta fold hydrolase n=1 Tax=Arthrobacter sp. MSA 4-2 TaxID=2794349 RepID=UPI0018E8514A|nr:alpha/beta hydrolase [Arthrobacter sp. MSA 4-2]MBJ2122546.1 alpha/beta hydrolase [Arthrobacter sp. MSA 4-2]